MRLLVAALAVLLVSPAHAADSLAPGTLPVGALELLARIEADPPPENLSKGAHFVVSDERRHDVFRPAIHEVGGMLVGVGTDQVYLLAAWARSEVVVPMDFDQVVVDLHEVYRLLFLHAKTPAEFVAAWDKRKGRLVRALIDTIPGVTRRNAAREAYTLSRGLVATKLANTLKVQQRQRVRSYLNDQAQYDYLVGLVRAGRVRPVRGDLTAQTTMKQIGDVARALHMPVRVLYLSNAEKYFPYSEQYRQNILGLPMDSKTQVLRTVGWGPEDAPRDDPFYIYLTQTGADFRAWLAAAELPSARQITRMKARTTTHGLYVIGAPKGE